MKTVWVVARSYGRGNWSAPLSAHETEEEAAASAEAFNKLTQSWHYDFADAIEVPMAEKQNHKDNQHQ